MIKKMTVLLFCTLMLVACNSDPIAKINILKDEETGCEYVYRHEGGVYPRITEDGVTHKGCKNVNKDEVSSDTDFE